LTLNVYTEWGKLKEVIVGSCVNIDEYNVDLSFRLFFHDNIKDEFLKKSIKLQQRLIEQREEDLNTFAQLLESEGIVVFRPRKLEKIDKFSTPNFEEHTCPVDNPRDQTLIIGDEIIETPCIWRRRYFENDLMKDIFTHYFEKGCKWTSAPRPEMKPESFDLSYVKRESSSVDWTEYDRLEKKFEIMFDGAQCLKFGRDLLMNIGNENHRLGLKWLERHLGDRFRIHSVELTDHHIDGMLMPLRPGTLLINPSSMKGKIDRLPKALQGWDIIQVPEEHLSLEKSEVGLASGNINVNVLPLDEKRVVIFEEVRGGASALAQTLEKNGFEPVLIQLRHSRIFGGGAHCVTLDTVREDSLEDFFN
jgi:glycine amidinotransferase